MKIRALVIAFSLSFAVLAPNMAAQGAAAQTAPDAPPPPDGDVPPAAGAPPEEAEIGAGIEAEIEAEWERVMSESRELVIEAAPDTPNTVMREEMDRAGAADLWEAVRDVPGVILSGGGRRGDSAFSVRGFGADSVPVYVDGISLANPFRG